MLPQGTGAASPSGLAQYHRLFELLLEHDIEPVPTLFHWDLPQALEDRGGFRQRESAWWFADYAALMAEEYGDTVDRWATFNEPWCYAYLGHVRANTPRDCVTVQRRSRSHHELLATVMRCRRCDRCARTCRSAS
ncbi:MAG: family 1 glycosylhydrolase [Ilumatobacteraceae bacterium]